MVVLGLSCREVSAAQERSQSHSYSQINLSDPEKSTPLIISIERAQSIACHWKPWQSVRVWGYVQRADGHLEALKDTKGKRVWNVHLNSLRQGRLTVTPAKESFTGRLVIKGNGKTLAAHRTLEKVYEHRFPDGASIRVYFTDQLLEESRQGPTFPKEVLDAAVSAYQIITQSQGFNTDGFSFVSPRRKYAYDPDKTIDIYLGNPDQTQNFPTHGFNAASFKDAPCFDTTRVSKTGFNAVILLPANYSDFIRNWELINPSPLGARNIDVDLRGTLIHEMLHVVLFYYNRNLNKEFDGSKQQAPVKKLDWYVEGLARYFETFAGARHDFYSQGFKQVLPDKIRFSRGGANYFMCYPDQSFMELRYENALFWRFIDTRYGMSSIERLSREFRGVDPENFKPALERVTGTPFAGLLKEFALAILLKDFELKDDVVFLKDVAKTKLVYRKRAFYLKDGYGSERLLGAVCETDWIGGWGDRRARHGESSVAGDSSDRSDVSGWATDYYEINIAKGTASLPELAVSTGSLDKPLTVQAILVTKGGLVIRRNPGNRLSLEEEIKKEGLQAKDIRKVYLLITNADSQNTVPYKIQTSQFA